MFHCDDVRTVISAPNSKSRQFPSSWRFRVRDAHIFYAAILIQLRSTSQHYIRIVVVKYVDVMIVCKCFQLMFISFGEIDEVCSLSANVWKNWGNHKSDFGIYPFFRSLYLVNGSDSVELRSESLVAPVFFFFTLALRHDNPLQSKRISNLEKSSE